MIRTNIRSGKYLNIFEYPNIRHTMFHSVFDGVLKERVSLTKNYPFPFPLGHSITPSTRLSFLLLRCCVTEKSKWRMAISRDQKELLEIRWCQNDWIPGAASDFPFLLIYKNITRKNSKTKYQRNSTGKKVAFEPKTQM